MSETPAEATASAPAGGASQTAAALEKTELTIQELLEAGVHFGHQTRRWNPRMKPFLYGERNGVHIVDLDQTITRFREALDLVRETAASGGKVLFVGTKKQAQAPIQLEAQRAGQYYVNNRWLGGMLTNFKTVKKSIERFKDLLEIVADEQKVAEFSKKDLSRINRSIDKYRKSLDGIREMTRLPDAVFVIDVRREAIAISEAQRLGIPIVAVVDSNCSPLDIEYVIPGNDDSIRAIQLYCTRIAQACLEGATLYDERIRAEVEEAEKAKGVSGGTTAPSGRVVVEITQPPRRGRGPASFADRRAAEETKLESSAAEAKPVAAEAKPAAAEAKPAAAEAKPAAADVKPAAADAKPSEPGGGSQA